MTVRLQKSRSLGSLSMTPLIDVVFLLLIFFLVATRFSEEEREMDVVLPEASAAKPLIAEPKQVFVNVDAAGHYFMAGQQLDEQSLERALMQAWTNNPSRVEVVIRGDRRSDWQFVATAMNLCNKTNIRNYKVAVSD